MFVLLFMRLEILIQEENQNLKKSLNEEKIDNDRLKDLADRLSADLFEMKEEHDLRLGRVTLELHNQRIRAEGLHAKLESARKSLRRNDGYLSWWRVLQVYL